MPLPANEFSRTRSRICGAAETTKTSSSRIKLHSFTSASHVLPSHTVSPLQSTADEAMAPTDSRRQGYVGIRSMDVTTSTINRTSPLDLVFARIGPMIDRGVFDESVDDEAPLQNDAPATLHAFADHDAGPPFPSNTAIIDSYSGSWNSPDQNGEFTHREETQFESDFTPEAGQTSRWPFITDDPITIPDIIEPEPLFPSPRIPLSPSRQCHRVEEELEEELEAQLEEPDRNVAEATQDPGSLTIPPFDFVLESSDVPATPSSRGRVMTSAEFEVYQRKIARDDAEKRLDAGNNEEEDADYDDKDDRDYSETIRQQRAQRARQEAHVFGYRQQMMKRTEGTDAPQPTFHARAPSVSSLRSTRAVHSSDHGGNDDDDVPLAILQAQRMSGERRPATRLAAPKPNPSLPTTTSEQPRKPGSIHGQASNQVPVSSLPAFARRLPQDPFAGYSNSNGWNPYAQKSRPAGLVGLIAGEERAKALRRVNPSYSAQASPSYQANPSYGVQANPGYSVQANPGYRVQTNPGYGVQATPAYGVQANPGYGVQTNPAYGVQANPGYGVQVNPGYGVQANPGYGLQVNPSYVVQANPGYGVQAVPDPKYSLDWPGSPYQMGQTTSPYGVPRMQHAQPGLYPFVSHFMNTA
ncbi:hypothetical protein AK830_g12567 [Neonectria ditissima]|uniref:Uncharacterized protein n=1 Tax=Neonectria ditissima TaxID=78410 RepID=A0A0P7B367_9HYPO|nr:hypothetical protein AK830_g12567 [Neonectria ditissima]